MEKYDFAGYATKNNVRCTDGRVIRKEVRFHLCGVTIIIP